jgi:hypothetical protein
MTTLENKYAWAEIDSMGWFANTKNKLSHNGLIDGGDYNLWRSAIGTYPCLTAGSITNISL